MNVNVYENIAIFNPSLSDEEIEAAQQRVKDLIAANQGELLKAEPWGRKKLAYELNKQTRGFFVLFLFRAPSSFIRTLEEFYKVYDPVFKYMVVRLEKKQREAALRSLAQEAAAAAPAQAEQQEAPQAEQEGTAAEKAEQ
jgi:small subunit ribosomal protein S6